MTSELWVTERCVREDLKTTFPDEAHPLIKKFRQLRAQIAEPDGDKISETRPRTLYKVDAVDSGAVWRGATWYDRKNDIVYLVAAGRRHSGARDDFYKRLPQRLGRIYPTKKDLDQVRLAVEEREVRALREQIIPGLIDAAQRNGQVVRWLAHCRVRLMYDQGVYALRLDPRPSESLSVKVAVATAQVFARVVSRPLASSDRQFGEDPVPKGCYVFYF